MTDKILGTTKPVGLSNISQDLANDILKNGLKDGKVEDDKVKTEQISIKVTDLRASQSEISIREVVSLFVYYSLEGTHKKGNTGIIVSKDNYIVDGHHRWIGICLLDPNATVEVTKVNLNGGALITALNIITKGKFGIRNGNKAKNSIKNLNGDQIIEELEKALKEGISGKHPKTPEMIKKSLGEDIEVAKHKIRTNVKQIPKSLIPGALPRKEMPVVGKKNIKKVTTIMNKGTMDIKEPFATSSRKVAEEVNKNQLDAVEKYADKELNPVDIEFTKHFFQRLNNKRNKKDITQQELENIFRKLSKNKEKFLDFLKKYYEIVVKDRVSNINIPFAKNMNKLFAKTIMRKPNFKTSSPVYALQEREYIPGGLAEGMSLEDIAKKHNINIEDLKTEAKRGIKIELEHTSDKRIAFEITKDHLYEDPHYYLKLSMIEEIIRKVDNKYAVYSKKGGKRLGTHNTKKEAEDQLQAIHINKQNENSINILSMKKEKLGEHIRNIIRELKEETAFIKTDKGTTKIASNLTDKQLDDLKNDQNIKDIETSKGEKIKEQEEEGIQFNEYETKSIGKETGKALALALREIGDQIDSMRLIKVEPNSFEIKVEYKNEKEDRFSFYIVDDTLHLVDLSFNKEISDVGVKPSGEAIINRDYVKNELVKHFRSLYESKEGLKQLIETNYIKLLREQNKKNKKLLYETYGAVKSIVDAQERGDSKSEKSWREYLKSSYWFDRDIDKEVELEKKRREEEKQRELTKRETSKKMSKREFERILKGAIQDMGGDPSYSEIMDVAENFIYDDKIKEKALSLYLKDNGLSPYARVDKRDLIEYIGDQMSMFLMEEGTEGLYEENLPEPESEEENSQEEQPDIEPTDDTVLKDSTETMLTKFPTLKKTIVDLHTNEYEEFIDSIDWISPRPSTFRVNITNGQNYILKWNGETFQAEIKGKRYFLSQVDEFQQALDKLIQLYKETPLSDDSGEEFEGGEAPDFSGGGGGGDFPGEEGGTEGGEEPSFGAEGEEETGGEDLSGEEIDFEEPAEEPE